MDYGRLSGKLYAHEDWIGMTPWARELLITVWSWAIDHDKADGEIPTTVLYALSSALGHNDPDHPMNAQREAVDDLLTWGWITEVEGGGAYFLERWDEERRMIAKAIERRQKERERYLRRKAQKGGDD